MEQHILSAENLQLGYDGRVIVDGMEAVIPEGKISIIIGANGCGKSTLLKSFASYQPKKLAQVLGLLPQSPVVPEGIKVADLVARGRFPYRKLLQNATKEDMRAVQDALEIMGITELCDRSVDELSGGQRQRVWIALALARQTDILLLDEPTTYLDIAYQVEILDSLAELNQSKGTTIVMVLHDINLSARYADWLFAMRKGKLLAQGEPADSLRAGLRGNGRSCLLHALCCAKRQVPYEYCPGAGRIRFQKKIRLYKRKQLACTVSFYPSNSAFHFRKLSSLMACSILQASSSASFSSTPAAISWRVKNWCRS